jgi:L-threonylcarbamoyladenylate synthase
MTARRTTCRPRPAGERVSDVIVLGEGEGEGVLDEVVRKAAAVLDDGRLVVGPADSMYGVLTNPFHPHGSDRVYSARGAERAAPLTVLVHSSRQLPAFAEVGPRAERLAAACWPGPLTLLLPAVESMAWDLGESAGTVAVRMPVEPVLLRLLAATGPLACTAAVRVGERPPATVDDAMASLGDAVALYVDAGPRRAPRSTVVDLSRGGAEVRRLGGVSADVVFATAVDPPDPGI